MNGLSKGLNIDQDDLILICNILTLHSHEVQSLGLVRIRIVWTRMWKLKAKVGCLPQLLPTLLFATESFTEFGLDWLAGKAQGISYQPP